jgi:hypothetical protein
MFLNFLSFWWYHTGWSHAMSIDEEPSSTRQLFWWQQWVVRAHLKNGINCITSA